MYKLLHRVQEHLDELESLDREGPRHFWVDFVAQVVRSEAEPVGAAAADDANAETNNASSGVVETNTNLAQQLESRIQQKVTTVETAETTAGETRSICKNTTGKGSSTQLATTGSRFATSGFRGDGN